MSSLMDPQIDTILGPLETLISDLSNPSTSNEQRSQAESVFNSCKQTDLVDKLVNLLEHSLDIDVRKMSAIQLGNIFEESESTQPRVKDCLLNCVVKEENRPIIEILGETISKLAPDKKVANTLLDRLASNDTSVQESALLIFPQLMQYVYDCKVPYMTRLHDVFMNCLGNLGSANVRIAALIAATSFIQRLKSLSRFQDLLPGMMKCLAEVLNGGDEAMTQKALVLLIELAETKPSFFTEHLVEVVDSMIQIAEAESLEEGTRHLAFEFVFMLAEVRKRTPRRMRDLPQLIVSRLFAILMRMLSDEAMTQKALILLIKLAETKPSFFTEHLVDSMLQIKLVDSMLQIAEAESLEEVTRHLAFEFVITLAIEFVNEQNKPIIKILGYTISMLGHDEYVANTLLDRVERNDSSLQESALLTFAQFLQYVIDRKVQYTISLPVTRLHDVFMNCLGKVGSADVRISALIAVTKVIQCLMTLSERDSFQDLLPDMMRCLAEVFEGGDEAMTQKALVLFIELAGTEPSFFKGQLEEVVGSMLQIAEAESLEEGTRHLAIKFVIMLAEVRKRTPLRMRDLPQLIVSRLFAILMRMLSDIEDEDVDEDEDAGESSNYSVGQEYLDRLAIALGGDTIVPVAYNHEQLHAYLAAPDRKWQERLAAVVALAQIAKGRSKVEIPNLEQVVTMVLKLFKDPHPRVRWAATNAIGQLSTYVGPSLQDQYHDRVLPALNLVTMVLAQFEDSHSRVRLAAIHVTGLLSTDLAPDLKLQYHHLVLPALAKAIYDFQYPQVQAHAVSAVVNISKNFPPDTSMPDMLEIVGNLRQFRRLEGIASDQTRFLVIEKLLKQFREELPPKTWASTLVQPASRIHSGT